MDNQKMELRNLKNPYTLAEGLQDIAWNSLAGKIMTSQEAFPVSAMTSDEYREISAKCLQHVSI